MNNDNFKSDLATLVFVIAAMVVIFTDWKWLG